MVESWDAKAKEAGEKMSGTLLASTDCEEALSRAYVAAVAGGAGFVTAVMDFDRDGVDVQIRSGGLMRPSLDIQLKATIMRSSRWRPHSWWASWNATLARAPGCLRRA
jgi:hypothetical protein